MIPKKIHYCWIGGNPLPESAKKCIKSWRKYCPDYEIIEWNETNYDFSKIPYMKEAYEAKKWGFVPDYARLDIIYTHGGIYIDTDVEMVRSFDPLLELPGFAGFQDERYVALGLGFGAEPGNPVIKALKDSYEAKHFLKEDGTPDLTPSPELNTETLISFFGLQPNGQEQTIQSFKVFIPEYFCPKSFVDGIIRKTKRTFSIHHFDASWYNDQQKQELKERWRYFQTKSERDERRQKKLRRRRFFGGMLRKLFGNKRWERIKKRILK